ncbi:2-hydroxy-3-oxopropionate reductase [Variovorax boronicumulans]|uniref:NAD(P)-dependent oxidoreductase n=1 Tax=Variovorax boronicumulans TaxID=436515 RepID=UPI00277EA943|nr:NAD(P)-binding domain-containing protein [Variovorax boronicumulans]MDQ0032869.1 2-hydroxy-3-oxopropionate reductase [Variovorax boronicumulans]
MTFNRQRIAVIGVGIMGSAIARRLLECGHAVSVFDLDKAKVQALQAQGAHAAPTAADAAAASDFVITSLNAAAVVERALFGENSVADAPADAQRLVIDMSSIDPPSTRRLAQTLRERTGMGFVDAPLSGGAPKALLGQLTVMAGGSTEDVTRARAVMDSLCANYTHMGESGAGQTTKLVNQLLCAIGFQAVAEAVRIAEAGGVDASKLPAALAGGRADSQILREFGPKMAARDYTPTGRIDNMLKDLEAVQGFAQGQRLPLPLAGTVSELHRTFVAAGLGPEDTAAMMRQFDGYSSS